MNIRERQTFKKRERLNKKEIRQLFREGKRVKSGDYLGIYNFNQQTFPRLAVTLKKKLGNAVKRNYEKRVIKEIIRNSKSLIPNVNLIIMKLLNNNVTFSQKRKDLLKLFTRIK
jgi:ribonuclease P protein component